MDATRASTGTGAQRALLVLSCVLGALACVMGGARDVPVQGWWQGRGPVVPHEGFPADCSLCHVGDGWQDIRADFEFDHGARTGTPLEGAHAAAECLRCHNDRGPVEVFAQRGCAGCHEDVHRGQLGKGCVDCHEQDDWRPREQIALHNRYGFPLVGRHAAAACWRCHENAQVGNFTRTPKNCAECHQADLANALVPDHKAQGWVSNCDQCHIPTSWAGAGFKHPWPLTGAHVTVDCADCHVGGVYAGTPNQCVDCHLDDYQSADDPDHVAFNFPLNCEQCHNTSSWDDAEFKHTGITSGCVTCHLSDYQGTNNPDHANAGFPTTCESCHNTDAWMRASFTHSFPITSGPHKIFDCSDCHLNPGNYASFSCTHCHDHNKGDMDDKHSRVPGYVWSSPACLQCHPDGKKD